MPSVSQLIVDLAAVEANYRELQKRAAPAEVGAALKANAYGLGAAAIGKALHQFGCRTFFVAHFEEALRLRAALPEAAAIAVLHGLAELEFAEALAYDITPVLNSIGAIEDWAAFARAQNQNLPAFVHLDTGLNRLGLPADEQKKLADDPDILKPLLLKGWMSHLACADEFENPMTIEQRDRFTAALAALPPAPASLSNSPGIFWGRDFVFDLARPGRALYGINPTPHAPNPMRQTVELRAPILQIHDVDRGMAVGYGASHRVARKGRIATLALGYADGYKRSLGNRGQVKIAGFLAPVVGRISMDLVTVDVSALPPDAVHAGTMATVIGPHRSVDDVALEAGTIGHDLLAGFGTRLERIYLRAESGIKTDVA
ncbi:MAG TPA: alanine racemase [Alphaproteobacteria bacterium]|nr:alanine racemase [Alphaproteobacteria bacterium]